ncbi:hypothetical protein BDC45DRAFT_531305 [Circinella umbellata]|nr:hypothetical protein BDC45DRAFT_531305 [Circinella umbellata]
MLFVLWILVNFFPWGSKYKSNTTARAIGRYLRRKAMGIDDLLFKRPSIIALQVLILVIMIDPNSDEDGSNGSRYSYSYGKRVSTSMSKELYLSCQSSYHYLRNKIEVELRRRIITYRLDRYGIDEDRVSKLLRETKADIRERRPVYGGFLHIIPLTRIAGDVVALLYLSAALLQPRIY